MSNNKIIIINQNEDINDFYRRVGAYKKMNHTLFSVEINNKIDTNTKNEINLIINLLNIKNKRKRFKTAYNYACDQVKNVASSHNFCEIKDGKCLYYSKITSKHHLSTCCGKCNYLGKNGCSIDCGLGCCTFYCPYIKKNKKIPNINDYNIIKYFFSWKQKIVIGDLLFITQDQGYQILKSNILLLMWVRTSTRKT